MYLFWVQLQLRLFEVLIYPRPSPCCVFPLCLHVVLCLALQHVGLYVAARGCDDFGEWRFRKTSRQEDAESVGQAVVAMCCASSMRLLVERRRQHNEPKVFVQYRVVLSSVVFS